VRRAFDVVTDARERSRTVRTAVSINTNSLSEGLIVIGFSILLLALVIGITYGIMKAIKEVPNMPFRQFVMIVLVVAVFMVIVGVLLP